MDLLSEPFSPSGNVAADGVRKLLGAPRLDLLQTLVREAVQNSCDAAKHGSGPRVQFNIRRLTSEQIQTLRNQILVELPEHRGTSDPIMNYLESQHPWVLEICDFGTTGLAGPTRADVPPMAGEHTDFVDFIRNVGSKRNTELGGGTYGYGKSALYLASNCGTIVVDSETVCSGRSVRRLIAAQLGEAYDCAVGGELRRFTGRHWWGNLAEGRTFVDPVEGESAKELSSKVGLPERRVGETGTSIMILDPVFGEDMKEVVGSIQESLLWYFWPRMMADVPPERRLWAQVRLDGVDQPVPAPEETAPLDLFCQAMIGIRRNGPTVQPIQTFRPVQRVGTLNIERGFRGERIPLRPSGESLFPQTSHHIAVMRPVELVVRYFDNGDPLLQEDFEWAGVFVTSKESDVEKAFADSEPPAHDDWQPEMLPAGSRSRRYVRIALDRIRDAAKAVTGGQAIGKDGHKEGPSLASVSDIFGRALGSVNGQGASGKVGAERESDKNPGNRKKFSVTRPVFEGLVEIEGGIAAKFVSDVRNESDEDLVLHLEASIVVDGGLASAEAAGYRTPLILSVTTSQGDNIGTGREIELGNYTGALNVMVRMPNDGAVTIKAAIEALT